MLKNRVLYSIGLLAALVFVLWSWIWIAALVMLIALLLPLLSLLLSAGLTRGIRYDISAPATVRRGDELSVVVSDRSTGAVADYIISVEVEGADGDTSDWIAELNSGERRAIIIDTEHCGTVRCRIRNAYACDYLGLFRFRLEFVRDAVTVIMPVPSQPEELPALSQINHTSYRPKYGGGFSEVHDMREYRPGDSLRDIHWKLSAKTDRLIVREPQVPERSTVLLTVDVMPPSCAFDRALDNLVWVSRWLCENDTEHDVRWISPASREVESFRVAEKSDIVPMLCALLSERADEELPSINGLSFSDADWHYHIGGEGER